jgi:UDP-N-acetylglucosamine diphosphorylase / glucose-1-phosphate thymidylyltransferase / UDP-N-acetylgalactosamine diphosphorylase / glucosamine-1-phosphate N-acetyltransferase / galactosamine-1-phosphate N-acetyltransferase
MNTSFPFDKAVILAAGKCSRFEPFTDLCHKSLFPLMGEPVMVKTLKGLISFGVKEIYIVKSPQNKSLSSVIEPFKSHADITLVDQNKPFGMANAILTAKDHLNSHFLVVSPQQVTINDYLQLLDGHISRHPLKNDEMILFTQETNEPEKYGMVGLKDRKVIRVTEKPQSFEGLSNERIVGVYLMHSQFLKTLAILPQSEYLFEEGLNLYCQNHEVTAISSSVPSFSNKYVWDLFSLSAYLLSKLPPKPEISLNAWIHPTAIIEGQVTIAEGAKIYEYAIIKGPCYIGNNTVVGSFCKVRNGTILEDGVELQNQAEIKHSLIGKNTHIHSGYIGDSIIGADVRIGAGFTTANRRFDRCTIKVSIKDEPIDTHLTAFGCLIGNAAQIGIKCGTNPGSVILPSKKILPGTIISHN